MCTCVCEHVCTGIHTCVLVCMCVCMYVWMCVCINTYMYNVRVLCISMHVCMCRCLQASGFTLIGCHSAGIRLGGGVLSHNLHPWIMHMQIHKLNLFPTNLWVLQMEQTIIIN